MLLSDFATQAELIRDGTFLRLGYFFTPGQGILAFAQNQNFLAKAIRNGGVTAIVTTPELGTKVPDQLGLVVNSDPRGRFFEIHERIVHLLPAPKPRESEPIDADIHPSSLVHPAAKIGRGVRIGEFSVVRARVTIGDGVVIEPGVKLGVDGILHRRVHGRTRLIPHGGQVIIGDGATLMANSIVVSAIFTEDSTSLGTGTLLGMNAIAGHEVSVGNNCVISNGVVLARHSHISDETFIGTGATIREYVQIGEKARVMAGSVVIKDVPANAAVSGNFATGHVSRLRKFVRDQSNFKDCSDETHVSS